MVRGGGKKAYTQDIEKRVGREKREKNGDSGIMDEGGWLWGRLCCLLILNITVVHDIFYHGYPLIYHD